MEMLQAKLHSKRLEPNSELNSGNHRYLYRQQFSIGSLNLELKENKAGEGKLTQKLQYPLGIWRNSACF